MKLRNLLFCLCSIVTLTSSAIEPVAQLFIAMPDSLVPSIEINRRKDLIDLMHAGQKAEIVTKLGGKAEMTLLQDSLLSIDLSKRSKMEIRWYDTTGNDTIIALVNTVYAPAGDSRIRFFDTAWKELPASERIRQIRREEFFQFPDSLTKGKKRRLVTSGRHFPCGVQLRYRRFSMCPAVMGKLSRQRIIRSYRTLSARFNRVALERKKIQIKQPHFPEQNQIQSQR